MSWKKTLKGSAIAAAISAVLWTSGTFLLGELPASLGDTVLAIIVHFLFSVPSYAIGYLIVKHFSK